jgi:hypothetical protein
VTSRRSALPITAALIALLFAASAAEAQAQGGPVAPLFPLSAAAVEGVAPSTPRDTLSQDPPAEPAGKKSVGLAVLYSLLLPGMGELYAGDYGSGKYFTGADGVLWLSLAAVNMHANSIQNDARTYAALHAGFDQAGKNDQYFVDVSNFNDVYAYNEQVLRDRDAYKLYDPTSPEYWKWDAGANRQVYRDQRVSADAMFNNTRFVVAGLMANRILSAINAAMTVISGNKALGAESLGIGATILGGPERAHGIALTITRQF